MRFSWTISKYLVKAILPYFIFSWLLLSVILFVQQASRFSDIFFSVNIPSNLVWQLTFALVPNVIAFTCPMAVLVGVIIGLSKMQGDSELVAIRASGVGNFEITLPVLILGILLSFFAFFINLKGVPFAAGIVRQVALQTAIYKLESPIEPGVFNTEVAGYTIYIKDGDLTEGKWKNIFVYNEDPKTGTVRLITSTNGRIDSTDQLSELVLENAVGSTITSDNGTQKLISESLGEVRYAIKTRRGEMIEKLSNTELTPDELGLTQLSAYAQSKDGKERTEAQILWQRRIILSITPLVFCLLGTALILRFSRKGRGFGITVALLGLIIYYLLAFLGEQLARTERISVFEGSLIPIVFSVFTILWFNFSNKVDFLSGLTDKVREIASRVKFSPGRQNRNLFVDLTAGLRDFDIALNLLKYYLLTLGFLAAVFIIFTAFELWKFAGTIDNGIILLVQYLFYLLPFIYIQLAPSSVMVATLATYVIKSRRNEIVTWTSAGQSVYRLLLPCLVFMIALGVVNWQLQERILPQANQAQDELRSRIRSRGVAANRTGKLWVANDKRIFSFELDETASDNVKEVRTSSLNSPPARGEAAVLNSPPGLRSGGSLNSPPGLRSGGSLNSPPGLRRGADASSAGWSADRVVGGDRVSNVSTNIISAASDNEKRLIDCAGRCVKNLTIYEFADDKTRLQTLYRSSRAIWERDRISFIGKVEKIDLREGNISSQEMTGGELAENSNPFIEARKKPSHLNIGETRLQVANSESEIEKRSFSVALEKKYTTAVLPFIIALFTAPFALSLSRKGKVMTVGYAVGLWLLFMGVTSTFEQFGLNGAISPSFAVWSPLMLFALFGTYLLSKVRT